MTCKTPLSRLWSPSFWAALAAGQAAIGMQLVALPWRLLLNGTPSWHNNPRQSTTPTARPRELYLRLSNPADATQNLLFNITLRN